MTLMNVTTHVTDASFGVLTNSLLLLIKDTQPPRIGAMVLGQDLNGGISYGQTVFTALRYVPSRYV